MGVARGTVDKSLGKIAALRLTVHSESENWAILSEVSFWMEQKIIEKIAVESWQWELLFVCRYWSRNVRPADVLWEFQNEFFDFDVMSQIANCRTKATARSVSMPLYFFRAFTRELNKTILVVRDEILPDKKNNTHWLWIQFFWFCFFFH